MFAVLVWLRKLSHNRRDESIEIYSPRRNQLHKVELNVSILNFCSLQKQFYANNMSKNTNAQL
jgi:hypothetical protein